jgi:AcrR family transcriptional regulator
MATVRKTPQSWIDAGLTALIDTGPAGLRAETLARRVGTTKGSFYWHFKDVPTFQRAVLDAWCRAARARFDAALAVSDTTVGQLRGLGDLHQTPIDAAVRAWALQNDDARSAVEEVDAHMARAISTLLRDLGATHPDFPGLIQAALVASPPTGTHVETLIDLLLMLK